MFTALTYAAVGKRFAHQRPAAAMSAAIGLALASGLVWWEYERGWSVRNLGPLAVGFAVILLAMVMYQGIRQVGGTWAGAGIAFGASILVAWVLGFEWPVAVAIVQTLAIVALVAGVVAFVAHSHGRGPGPGQLSKSLKPSVPASSAESEWSDVRHDMRDLTEDSRVGGRIGEALHGLRERASGLFSRPGETPDVLAQLRQVLPAEGWLTEQLARLRRKALYMRKGHVARIRELRQAMKRLPLRKKQLASWELSKRYQELHFDQRLERLDKAVAEFERRIRDLTSRAQQSIANYEYQKVEGLLKEAEKLQTHNSKLLKQIEHTEEKITHITQQIAHKINEVDTE